ncbi:MAG: hypothetical protein HC765_07700, partial [Brachymonas sp.]|nr:hypothetical protein [Brachymonas sp.]
ASTRFSAFSQYSKGLEAYPDALAQIQRYWPGPQSLEMIEEMIFRQPDATSQPFDMQAYRELMLLYTLAKNLNKPGTVFQPVAQLGAGMRSGAAVPGLSAGLSLLDDLPHSGAMDLPLVDGQDVESLGLDLSMAQSSAVQLAIAKDDTMSLPALSLEQDNSIDFDLSHYDDLPPKKSK